ncbi:glycoside hydrolase [Flavobacterium defluvii]|uniref:O-Glycosyl hydrolase n=1 Tax=Flavobacterium defluvii TaxID=370979 RepID=A0A1M5VBN4_9FLAO|nr:glycoside hydrolase [Flavobacterium defluvii]SHH72558.1 O-Glycosyl hydrolase [Flavobacterium defluvii]
MRKIYISLLLITSSLSFAQRTVTISTDNVVQTMDGFGGSDAWRTQFVGKNWPEQKKNAIADLLFSKEIDAEGNPKGIGLSIWRFNLGAGSAEQGENSKVSDEWRRSECFLNADGTYDFSKQEGQRWFLQAAKKRGVEKFLIFTNSPPVSMTNNGLSFASQKNKLNLKDGAIPKFADFLVQSIQGLEKKEGIKFDYVSPINEPQWEWMSNNGTTNSQEGTPATNDEIYALTKSLSEKLKANKMSTEIVIAEAGQINYLYENVNAEKRDNQIDYFFGKTKTNISKFPNVKNVILGHSYFTTWPIDKQVLSRKLIAASIKQNPGLKYWQSEYCILENPGENEIPGGSGGGRDLGMQTALFVARLIHNDIAVANAASWQWWTSITRVDYKDGLIYLDDGKSNGGTEPNYVRNDGEFHDSKLLWALGNYSLFVRPGMQRIDIPNQNEQDAANDVMLTAYKDVQNKKLIVVAVNCGKSAQKYKFELSKGTLKNNELTPYVTSENSNLKRNNVQKIDNLEIPARSVVTFVGELQY